MNKLATKIVLAEDEEMISSAYKLGLTHLGYEVVVASDGVEALAALRSDLPDVLLLDIIMPNMNGFEALEAIRKDPMMDGLRVIVVSNLSQPADEAKALSLGAQDYLIKADHTLAQLVERIERVLAEPVS